LSRNEYSHHLPDNFKHEGSNYENCQNYSRTAEVHSTLHRRYSVCCIKKFACIIAFLCHLRGSNTLVRSTEPTTYSIAVGVATSLFPGAHTHTHTHILLICGRDHRMQDHGSCTCNPWFARRCWQ